MSILMSFAQPTHTFAITNEWSPFTKRLNMKIKVYLHTSPKSNEDSNLRQVCFRVREGGTDLRCRTDLLANPAYWDETIPGYRNTSKLDKKEVKRLNQTIADITTYIFNEFNQDCDGAWLREHINEFLHPDGVFKELEDKKAARGIYKIDAEPGSLVDHLLNWIDIAPICKGRKQTYMSMAKKLRRYELFKQQILGESNFILGLDTLTIDEVLGWKEYYTNEYIYFQQYYDEFYRQFNIDAKPPVKFTENHIATQLKMLKTFLNYMTRMKVTSNDVAKKINIRSEVYAEPVFLTIEERDRLYDFDMTHHVRLRMSRDIFVFQCLTGCRIGDLYDLTKANIKGEWLEYYPKKSLNGKYIHHTQKVRVPLCDKAMSIIKRYADDARPTLFPFKAGVSYNYEIKMLLLLCDIDRMVLDRDPETKEYTMTPLYEAASSHTARKTFIHNLYIKVKDPEVIASMTGHCQGTKVFRHYRKITDELKQELVDMID